MSRPLIAIPARFSHSASALRYGAVVVARKLSEGVIAAGGEPVIIHPVAPNGEVRLEEIAERLNFVDGVLLPGGGDLDPACYGQATESDHVYDVDDEQDAFDLALAEWALHTGVPTLAICRGMQVVNVSLGGTLEQHMTQPHRHYVHDVTIESGTKLQSIVGARATASCYHHQRVDRIGEGLAVTARAADGSIEGLEFAAALGWFVGVQWHPEDTWVDDEAQLELFRALVTAAR